MAGRPHVHLRALSSSSDARGGSKACEQGSCKQRWRALADFGPQWGERERPAVRRGSKATSLQLSFNWTYTRTGPETESRRDVALRLENTELLLRNAHFLSCILSFNDSLAPQDHRRHK